MPEARPDGGRLSMQCRECGFEVGGQALFCPSCGARLVSADPAAAPPVPAAGAVTTIGAAPTAPQPLAARAAGPRPGDTLGSRWRLEKFLGQGSLCNAYLCRDLAHGNREVVLKAMHSRKSADPALAESFLFLAESVAKYEHRGIAKVYESGYIGSTPFYAMEWVSGIPLRLWLMERLTFENRVLPGLRLVRSLLDIFENIHERGCYGCLKPENVFITLSGPVVTDFGVVGFLTPQEFEFNACARRYLPYMAPELRQDWSNLIPHSDYYSLGAILYEVLAGRAPSSPLRLPSELSDLFGIEADEIILKAMAPKPLDRFGTLEAFRAAVDALQSALLAVPGAPQPGSEGSRTLQVASDLTMVPEPVEASFATPPGPAPFAASDAPRVLSDAMSGPDWSRESDLDSIPGEVLAEAAPGRPADEVLARPEAVPPEGGRVEAGHVEEGRIEEGRIEEGHVEEGAYPAEGEDGRVRSVFAALGESDAATPRESVKDEVPEEPIPAWLWISIALAGCCMVVLSAYFGLLLQR